jgi:hypothetical protein
MAADYKHFLLLKTLLKAIIIESSIKNSMEWEGISNLTITATKFYFSWVVDFFEQMCHTKKNRFVDFDLIDFPRERSIKVFSAFCHGEW